MMFNKIVPIISAVIGAASFLTTVAALPTNITESEIEGRSISPDGGHIGQLTYLEMPAGRLGACGWFNYDYEWVVGISRELYDNYPGAEIIYPNPACGRVINISYGGKTIRVVAVDRCEGCSLWDLELKPSAYQQFAPLTTGRLYGASWNFV